VGKVYLHAGIAAHKNIIPEKQYYPLAISTKSHRRLTMRPERPVLHMCRNFLHGHGIWYGVSSVFIDTSQNKFRLLWGQEIILIREGRNKKPCDHSRHQGDEAFNDLNVMQAWCWVKTLDVYIIDIQKSISNRLVFLFHQARCSHMLE